MQKRNTSMESGGDRHELGFPAYRLRGLVAGVELRFPLRPGLNRVGSGAGNDLVLEQLGVSREHAMLVVEPGRVEILDQKSKNGTFVDGRRVRRRLLTSGATLSFGPQRLAFEVTDPDDALLALELTPTPRGDEPPDGTLATGTIDPKQAPSTWQADRKLVFPPGYVQGQSDAAQDLHRQMGQLAQGRLPVLIVGETGVGKELAARILHESSDRRDRGMVAINCAAIPAQLLEAELFGIGDRVATGVAARRGRFREADGGTLFLDEIGEMAPELQAKLLRVLQEGIVEPVGAPPARIDVRLLAATNVDVRQKVKEGRFRSDLYFRLAGHVLSLPPLRRRREDIPRFVESLLREESRALGKPIRGLTVRALRKLEEHDWPGNVRELEHQIRRLVCLCPANCPITAGLVHLEMVDGAEADTETAQPAEAPQPAAPGFAASLRSRGDLDLATIECEVICEALRRVDGNQVHAARLLGISRYRLRRRMALFDIHIG